MSGYKAGYSEEHSPWYEDGLRDAEMDAARVGNCPPMAPEGPDQRKVKSRMYRDGYATVVQVPHQCTDKCKRS